MLQVTYQTDLFLDKNKDYVVPEHQELLNASKCAFVASLFPPLPEDSTKSSKFSSIGTGFKVCWVSFISLPFSLLHPLCALCVCLCVYLWFSSMLPPGVWIFHFIVSYRVYQHQLQSLLETLSATEPHYIRCVKPNNLLKPAIFENGNVLHQLRCGVNFCSLVCLVWYWINSLIHLIL